MTKLCGVITSDTAGTIPAMFHERVRRTPNKIAYRQFDAKDASWKTSTWREIAMEAARWQVALEKEGLKPGDRVALMVGNGINWVIFDQAALGLGLVTVPLYAEDSPGNVSYIIGDADVKLLLVQNKHQWESLLDTGEKLESLQRIVSVENIHKDDIGENMRLRSLSAWLHATVEDENVTPIFQDIFLIKGISPDDMASIVYTSGTTGRPKGVMLSHKNILTNAYATYQSSLECKYPDHNVVFSGDDSFLSFLPLSHMFERIVGYMLPMMVGAEVAYARSISQLGEDLQIIKPTVLVSVPRIYEKVYAKIHVGLEEKSSLARTLFEFTVRTGWARFEHQQGRENWSPKLLLWPLLERLVARKVMEKLGGRIQMAVSGGAALSPEVARLFIGLGLPLIQGYGLTEASPVISCNRISNNLPASIGTALPGVLVRIGENDELETKSDCVMLGYYNNEEATRTMMTEDGWLRTGDKALIDGDSRIYITGRIKEIIVLANGEKVPPADMEMAITLDGLFEQAMVVGEAKPYLTALLVLNPERWKDIAGKLLTEEEASKPKLLNVPHIREDIAQRLRAQLRDFPGYARIRNFSLSLDPWTIENGLLTPTLKVKRPKVIERFMEDIDRMYQGHTF
ncbi:MAG: AMP-dependent synthetase/ligase [Patescibacteria group bacterium]|nr:MAG: AMP-dependent synthetase/ligase [Patescibacteria group bacterium]